MTKAERNRLWRASREIAALEVPQSVAKLVRRLREERGGTTAALLAAALDALRGAA